MKTSETLERPQSIWFGDAVRSWDEAKVHVWSEVVLRAASVFEGLRGYWDEARSRHYFVHLDAHMERLAQSAKVVRIPRTITVEYCLDALGQMLRTLRYREDVYARPTLFLEQGRYSAGNAADDCGFFMPVFTSPREASIDSGVSCQVSSWRRSDDTAAPPRVKAAASYYNIRLARIEASAHGFDEAILLNSRGFVAETGGASIFAVRGGEVVTPHLGSSILESITRRSALELLTEDFGIPVEQRDVERTELYAATEVFLTGTLCEITPVVNIDGLQVGDGTPGPVTRALQSRYYEVCRSGPDDKRGWLTPGPVLD